jgi:hypothetical protein
MDIFFLYVCNLFLKKDRKIANTIKGTILLFCLLITLFAKHLEQTSEALVKVETEQNDQTKLQQAIGLEATLPLQKINFTISFDFVAPFTFIENISINPTVLGFSPLYCYFKEVFLCSIPSLAP